MLSAMPNLVCHNFAGQVAAGYLAASDLLCLFNTSLTPGAGTLLADFLAAECAFTGYARIATPGSWVVGLDDSGLIVIQYPTSLSFAQTGTAAVDQANGWFLVDSGAAALKGSGIFDSAFQFNKTGNRVDVVPSMQFGNQSDATVATLVGP